MDSVIASSNNRGQMGQQDLLCYPLDIIIHASKNRSKDKILVLARRQNRQKR